MKKIWLLVLMTGVASCSPPLLEIQNPRVTAHVNSSVPNQQISSYGRHILRSYAMAGEDGARVEMSGARCQITSQEISLTAVTPAELEMPSFVQRESFAQRGKPSPLSIRCEGGGLSGEVAVAPVNIARGRGPTNDGTVAVTPISGAPAGTAPWGYPYTIEVEMR